MRRLPHGATTRPGPERPASGYGRLPGRPGPSVADVPRDPVDPVAGVVEAAETVDQAVISASAVASPGEPGPVPAI